MSRNRTFAAAGETSKQGSNQLLAAAHSIESIPGCGQSKRGILWARNALLQIPDIAAQICHFVGACRRCRIARQTSFARVHEVPTQPSQHDADILFKWITLARGPFDIFDDPLTKALARSC